MTKPNDGQSQDQPVAMKKGSYEFAAVCPAVWRDKEYRKQLTLEQRHIWLHLLTSPTRTHFPGLLRTTIKEIAALVDLSPRKVAAALEEFKKLGWAEYDAEEELLYLPKALKYNPPDNEKQLIHWVRVWSSFPECYLTKLALDALRYACELSPDLTATIEREVALGPYKDRPKPRKNRSGNKGQQGRGTDTVSGTVASTVALTSPIPFTTHHSPLTNVEEQGQLPSPPPVGAGALTGPARPSFATETQPTQPTTATTAAPVRLAPAVDASGQASLIPATGKPDRRRKPAGEPEDEPTATADLDRYVARWNELKKPPFPLSLTKEDRIFFFQQRKARGIEELVWVLEVLHGDDWSAGKTIRQLVSAEAAQKAAGLNAKTTKEPAFRSNRHAQSHENLDDVWQQP
jgi:hypothetical protein